MKRKLFSLLSIALLLCLLTGAALADGVYYYSGNYPLYVVDSLSPYGYCYMYDRPTSTWGENLGRYDNGETVKVISTQTGNEYYLVVDMNNRTGYINGNSLLPYGQTRNVTYYYVDSVWPVGYCYMYDRPTSTWGENLGRYDNGDEFVMLNWDANENYALVCSTRTGKQGYVSKSSLVKKGQQSNNQTATVRSELGYIYLYDRPTSTWGENLGRYDNGEVVNVISWRYNDNYAKVTTADGKMGYMLRSRLSLN